MTGTSASDCSLLNLDVLCDQIRDVCEKYDFSKDVKANGFRTFLKIVDLVKKIDEKDRWESLLSQIAACLLRIHQSDLNHEKIDETDEHVMQQYYSLASKLKGQFDPIWITGDGKVILDEFLTVCEAASKDRGAASKASLQRAIDLHIAENVSVVQIQAKTEWMIKKTSGQAAVVQRVTSSDIHPIDCLIIRPQTIKHEDSILFYVHGGGFVIHDPQIYAPALALLAEVIGVTIVAPDYRKSKTGNPSNKHPTGLQDVLDTYMFFTSGDEKVALMTGCQVKNVILSGESAGGNLCISLLYLLHMIDDTDSNIHLPTGIHIQYPYPTPGPKVFPSTFMEIIDPILTADDMSGFSSMYACTETDLPADWHETSGDNLFHNMHLFDEFLADPLFNNLSWTRFAEMKTPLTVMVCEFDPLLDSGVQLAKKWPASAGVTLRVAQGLFHGFVRIMCEMRGTAHPEISQMVQDINQLFMMRQSY